MALSSRAKKKRTKQDDPSLEYYGDPCAAPAVRQWRSQFPGASVTTSKILDGHRTVVKLSCRVGQGFGLFIPGTHEIAPSSAMSRAHSPRLNAAIGALSRTTLYDAYRNGEEKDSKTLNYVCLSEERGTGKVSVVFVYNASRRFDKVDELAKELLEFAEKADGVVIHSIHAHLNAVSPHDNAIYGRDGVWEQVWPPASVNGFDWPESGLVKERLFDRGPLLRFAPPTFRQANLTQFAEIVRKIATFVPKRSRVLELYAGVCTISAHLAAIEGVTIAASDENPYNARCVPDSIAYTTSPASEQVAAVDDADLVIVDPPRKGLCKPVLDKLIRLRKRKKSLRLIYVSCGFDAFRRDLGKLRAASWRLDHVEGHVLFPGANHIETLAVLTLPFPSGRREAVKTFF